MKKHRVRLLAAVSAAILLTSCSGSVVPPATEAFASGTAFSEPSEPSVTSASAEITPPAGLADALSGLWEKIDGSPATLPLTDALHGIFGGADKPLGHYITASAYYNLLNGMADLIFVPYPTESELTEFRNRSIELDIIPVFKDALVFLANSENPVDSVSTRQLLEIYTGKLTNWKTLGGLNETIAAYQRPQDSGSQMLLTKLVMDGQEPVRPPTEWLMDIGGLAEVVSSYDNARGSIGYSMFYYVNNMYGSSNFKLLGVDGVKPSRDTITRGEYPLEDYYCAVVRKDIPTDSAARKLIDWLLTDDGQAMAARAGYIPLRPLANVVLDKAPDPVYLGDIDDSSGTGGTVLKPQDAIDDIVVNGVGKPLSDLFYDGFNYIRYINSEITNWLNSQISASVYCPGPVSSNPSAAENAKRAFTGIPNNYPSYELADMGQNNRYLRIKLPGNNPFFSRAVTFDIRLTSDISPYGIGLDDFSVTYHYGRRMLPNVDLFTLDVKLPQSPEVAESINSQLKAWTDGFPGNDSKAEFLDMFVKWYGDGYYVEHPEFAYRLQPSYGRWGNYLSVSYPLQTYDGPSLNMPTIYTICFDMNTGEAVNLTQHLPQDIPYSKGMVYMPVTEFEAGKYPNNEYGYYVPAEGSVITSAWLGGSMLGLYVTEPGGRKLQVYILDWEKK